MTLKVLIADDHKLFRQGLIGLMHTRDDLVEVIGEATTGCEAVELVGSLHPDVVLMDIYMPEGDGLQALRQIRDQFPKVRVVMLTSSESDDHLYEAVQHGAAGYLLKNLEAEQLFDLLDGVTQGEAAMTREMASRLLKGIAIRSADPERGEEPLTQRELAVLRLVTVGSSNQDIADQLTISINTVKSRISSILDKLQLENRTQAAIYAIHHGLVSKMENHNY
jgi:DNA-binding NarL/FixJ family response regulator